MPKSRNKRGKKTESSPFTTLPEREGANAKWIIAVVAILGGIGAWWSFGGSGGEGGPMVAVTVPGNLSPAAAKGQMVFNGVCAACHGENAVGGKGGPPLIHPTYRPNHHADGAIRQAVMSGVRQHHWSFGNMPPQPNVSGADIDALIAFIRETQRASGIR